MYLRLRFDVAKVWTGLPGHETNHHWSNRLSLQMLYRLVNYIDQKRNVYSTYVYMVIIWIIRLT